MGHVFVWVDARGRRAPSLDEDVEDSLGIGVPYEEVGFDTDTDLLVQVWVNRTPVGPEVTKVDMESDRAVTGITTRMLANFPLSHYVQRAVRIVDERSDKRSSVQPVLMWGSTFDLDDDGDVFALRRATMQGPTDDALQAVAWVYWSAAYQGHPPAQSVADILNLPRSTAGRWVRKARERGYLTEATDRRSGGEWTGSDRDINRLVRHYGLTDDEKYGEEV